MKILSTIVTTYLFCFGTTSICALDTESTPTKPAMQSTATPSAVAAKTPATTVHTLITAIRDATDLKTKETLTTELSQLIPINEIDINDLFTLAETDSSGALRSVTIDLLLSPNDPTLGSAYAKRIKKEKDFHLKGVAVKMAGKLKNTQAVPDLIKVVDAGRTKEYGVALQFTAIEALGEIGDERAIPILLKHLREISGETEQERAIAKFGKKVLPQLLAIVRNPKNFEDKKAASGAIALMRDKTLVPQMWQIFKNPNDKTRYAALGMLLETADDTTAPTSTEIMNFVIQEAKTNPAMLNNAVDVARRRHDIPYLIKTFQDTNTPHNLKTSAIIFLGDFKAKSAVSALKEALSDQDIEIRDVAAKSLNRIAEKK